MVVCTPSASSASLHPCAMRRGSAERSSFAANGEDGSGRISGACSLRWQTAGSPLRRATQVMQRPQSARLDSQCCFSATPRAMALLGWPQVPTQMLMLRWQHWHSQWPNQGHCRNKGNPSKWLLGALAPHMQWLPLHHAPKYPIPGGIPLAASLRSLDPSHLRSREHSWLELQLNMARGPAPRRCLLEPIRQCK